MILHSTEAVEIKQEMKFWQMHQAFTILKFKNVYIKKSQRLQLHMWMKENDFKVLLEKKNKVLIGAHNLFLP